MWSYYAIPGASPFPNCQVFINREVLQTLPFGVSVEVSLARRGSLNHWLSAADSTSSPLPLPRGQGVRPEVPTLYSQGGLQGPPSPGELPKPCY